MCQQDADEQPGGRNKEVEVAVGPYPKIQSHLSSYFHVLSHVDINPHLYPLQEDRNIKI